VFVAGVLLTGCGLFGPPRPIFTASGTIVGPGGKGLPGAVVSDGQVSTLTDEAGRFALAVFRRALGAAKPGFAIARWEALGDQPSVLALAADDATERIGLDARGSDDALAGLRATLGADGALVAAYPATALARLDVLVMITPGALPPGERGAIAAWVRAGGRLVLCGEWGGYPNQDLAALNELAGGAGIAFTGGTVRSVAGEALTITTGPPAPASLGKAAGGQPAVLYAASDLVLSGAARTVLTSTSRAYAVLAAGGVPIVAAVGPAGLGKVFALGDSSLWRDADSEGSGLPNIQHGGNAGLARALVGW